MEYKHRLTVFLSLASFAQNNALEIRQGAVHSFLLLSVPIVGVYCNLFIYSLVEGYLGNFWLLAIMNKDAS